MKLMKQLTTLTLTAAIVPAFALGTAAIAQDQGASDIPADEQRDDAQRAVEQRADEQRDDAQRAVEQRADAQRAEGQRAEQEFISHKPAGALYADDLIGKTVKQRQSGDDVGEIRDLMIGDDGRIVGVVVTSGSFLGLGGQEVSLGWDQLEHSLEDDESVFYTDMDEETLRNAPEFERN